MVFPFLSSQTGLQWATGCHVVGPSVRRCEIGRLAGPIAGDRSAVSPPAALGNGRCGGEVAVTDGWRVIAGVRASYCEFDADDGCHAVWHAHGGDRVKSRLLPVLFSHVADQPRRPICATSTSTNKECILMIFRYSEFS